MPKENGEVIYVFSERKTLKRLRGKFFLRPISLLWIFFLSSYSLSFMEDHISGWGDWTPPFPLYLVILLFWYRKHLGHGLFSMGWVRDRSGTGPGQNPNFGVRRFFCQFKFCFCSRNSCLLIREFVSPPWKSLCQTNFGFFGCLFLGIPPFSFLVNSVFVLAGI